MDSHTHTHMIASAQLHIEELQREIEEHRKNLPAAKYKLRAAQEHLAEHQKDLARLLKIVPQDPPAIVENQQ